MEFQKNNLLKVVCSSQTLQAWTAACAGNIGFAEHSLINGSKSNTTKTLTFHTDRTHGKVAKDECKIISIAKH